MTRPAVLTLAFAGLAAAAAADPPAPAATVQDVVYFAKGGPVRLRLRVTVDGKPVEAAWQAAVEKLFAYCDRDGNGTLDAKERAVFTRPARPQAAVADVDVDGNPVGVGGPQVFAEKDPPADRAAFAAKLRAAELGPVAVPIQPAGGDAGRLTEALFRHLDRDGDGSLSAAEAKAAADRFAALDLDEDELVTDQELLGTSVTADPNRFVRLPGRREAQVEPTSVADLLALPPGSAAAVKEVLRVRDADKSGSLSRGEFGAEPKPFAALDKDGNAQLDTDEMAAWLRQPPDLEYAVAFDGQPAAPPPARVLADARVTLQTDGRAAKALADGWGQTAARLRAEFDRLAKDKKAVGRKQLDNNQGRGLLPLFDLADRNDDKTLTKDELDAALAAVGAAAACRVEITVVDGGRGLFELFDRDGDRQLSPREAKGAAAVAQSIDRDGDGKVGRGEVPRLFPVAVTPAAITLIATPQQRFVPPGVVAEVNRPRPGSADVPAWFARMDRNGDGDVSAREFLGPAELFRKLDRDGDGLLAPDEAKAAK
jgi:Ca2+-binding EF-hand superfamily protein